MGDFTSRWLAEAVRLDRAGARDEAAEQHARTVDGDAEHRILAWGQFIAHREGQHKALQSWRQRALWSLLLFLVLGLVAGFSAAMAVLGDGSTAVNVIWALGSLLGVNLLLLFIWLVGFAAGSGGGGLGRIWYTATSALQRRFQQHKSAVHLTQAFGTLTAQAGLTRWWLSLISHLGWLALLSGVLLGLALGLALRSYIFVWQTTILPASVFVGLVEALGWLPGMVGFSTPDADAILASALQSGDSLQAQADGTRRAWASWLTGCVLVYGILPRLLLSLLCWARLTLGLRRLRLQPQAPGWMGLSARLSPASEKGGVTDPAPRSVPSFRRRQQTSAHGKHTVVVGLEIPDASAWPPTSLPGGITSHLVDNRQQRDEVLALLAAQPPAKLLLCCSALQSPDRGSLHWLSEALSQTGNAAVWLLFAGSATAERLQVWRESLLELGLTEELIFNAEVDALAWLQQEGS